MLKRAEQIGTDAMADVEHHVDKLLIEELEEMSRKEEHYNAKCKVMAENVKQHIKEEDRDMLPKTRSLDIDWMR